MSNLKPSPDYRWAWAGALALFVLAGATGALLRFGLLYGFPAALQYANVRHAHSHLMYFGWVTPALMALIAAHLQRFLPGRRAQFGPVIGATLFLAVLAYVPFLLYGYQPAEIGGRRLPLAVIASTLNMFAWYAFAASYFRATWRAGRNHAMRLWDAALVFLILASLGAWGLALANALGIDSLFWSLALSRLFLDLFADGWFVLAVLGLAYAAFPAAAARPAARWGEGMLLAGLPVIFFLGMPGNVTPPAVRWLAGVGGVLVAAGLWMNVYALWTAVFQSTSPAWRLPLIFLGVKATAVLVISLPAGALWAQNTGLQVSYLHWLLLGFVTLGLVAAAGRAWGTVSVTGQRWLTAGVLLLILSLIPLTRLWPAAWSGRWALLFAAYAALGPVLVMSVMLIAQRRPIPKGKTGA